MNLSPQSQYCKTPNFSGKETTKAGHKTATHSQSQEPMCSDSFQRQTPEAERPRVDAAPRPTERADAPDPQGAPRRPVRISDVDAFRGIGYPRPISSLK